jgi:hypothetical protein
MLRKFLLTHTVCENVMKLTVVSTNYVKNTKDHEEKGKRVLCDSASVIVLGLCVHLLHIKIFCANTRRDITQHFIVFR